MDPYANQKYTDCDRGEKSQDRFKKSGFEGNWLRDLKYLNAYNINVFLDVKHVVWQKCNGVSKESIALNVRT
jgi:hypothetical protein